MQQFQANLQTAIRSTIAANVQQPTVGAIALRVVFDRQGKPLKCEAKTDSPKLSGMIPGNVMLTDATALARTVTDACWKTIYPTAPEAMYSDKGTLEAIAPLGVRFDADPQARWPVRNAQRSFFRRHLLDEQQVSSVGVAVIRYQADATGKTTGCLVNLRAASMRIADFKLDGALQSRLNDACMKLDLSQMPGFALNQQNQAMGIVSLEYAPWTVGRP